MDAWRTATLAGVVLVLGLSVGCGGGDRKDGSPRASQTTAPPGSTSTTRAAPSATQLASTLPPVGEGWFLVLSDESRTQQPGSGARLLELVGPDGSVHPLRRWTGWLDASWSGPWAVLDWSPDGRRALLDFSAPPGYERLVVELDLLSGEERQVVASTADGDIEQVRYGEPDAATVEVLTGNGASPANFRLERRSRAGEVLGVLWSGLGDGQSPPGWAGNGGWLESPDGATVVVAGTSGLAVHNGAGQRLRTLPGPEGFCSPARWWDPATVVAACHPAGSHYHRLWLFPVAGGRARQLIGGEPADPVVDFGHVDAIAGPAGSFAQSRGDCGAAKVERFTPATGQTTTLAVEGSAGGEEMLLADARGVAVWSTGGCDAGGGWFGWVTADGHRTVLRATAPGTAGFASVTAYAGRTIRHHAG